MSTLVVIPFFAHDPWAKYQLRSVLEQSFDGTLEIVILTDREPETILKIVNNECARPHRQISVLKIKKSSYEREALRAYSSKHYDLFMPLADYSYLISPDVLSEHAALGASGFPVTYHDSLLRRPESLEIFSRETPQNSVELSGLFGNFALHGSFSSSIGRPLPKTFQNYFTFASNPIKSLPVGRVFSLVNSRPLKSSLLFLAPLYRVLARDLASRVTRNGPDGIQQLSHEITTGRLPTNLSHPNDAKRIKVIATVCKAFYYWLKNAMMTVVWSLRRIPRLITGLFREQLLRLGFFGGFILGMYRVVKAFGAEGALVLPKFAVGRIYSKFNSGKHVLKSLRSIDFRDAFRDLPDAFSVEVIIPTRDKSELLIQCLESILATASGNPKIRLSITIVDNRSIEHRTKDVLSEYAKLQSVKIVTFNEEFNFSKLNNLAASLTDADYVCLVNNDVEFLESGWLEKMLLASLDENTGSVGALLKYPSGAIQHIGIYLGKFLYSSHPLRGKTIDNLPQGTIGVMANTGACLLVSKSKYTAIGGMDEKLPIGLNDVDLCIRLAKSGGMHRLVTDVNITHHESASRGRIRNSLAVASAIFANAYVQTQHRNTGKLQNRD